MKFPADQRAKPKKFRRIVDLSDFFNISGLEPGLLAAKNWRSRYRPAFAFSAIPCAICPVAVHAEQPEVLDEFQNDSLLSERSGIVGVRDRPQPEYDPVPYRIGGAEFMPSISVDTVYDSNIFAVPDARDDLVIRVKPALSASTKFGSLNLSTAAEIDRRQYLSVDSQSTTDYTLGVRARLDISRDSEFYGGTRSGRRTEDRVDPDSPLNLRQPAQYRYASAYFGAAHSFNRLRLAGRLGAETRNYSDGRDGLDNLVDQDFRNRALLTADAAAEYAINPDISVFVNASVNERNYDQQPALSLSRNSAGYRLTAGGSFEIGKFLRVHFDLGYFDQDFEDDSYSDVGGLAASAKFEYFATPLLTLNARANRGVEESSTIGSGAFVATSFSLTADYEFLRNVVITAGANYETNKFTDIDRSYRIYGVNLAAEWKLSPRYSLHIQYDYRDQNASGASLGREFSKHVMMAGITIGGL
jgi:hypothetical protein